MKPKHLYHLEFGDVRISLNKKPNIIFRLFLKCLGVKLNKGDIVYNEKFKY